MQKQISLAAKCTIVALLITLVLSSFPTVSVTAKGKTNIEDKWGQLVTTYNRQSSQHISVHNWVDTWFRTHKDAATSDKNEITRHLTICNSAIVRAGNIVMLHNGFDSEGNVVDKGAAQKSIKDLAYYLRQHAGSVRNLEEHVR